MLGENLQDVYNHFKQIGLTSDQYLLDWLLTLFCRKVPLNIAARVVDIFLLEGEVALFLFTLSILKLLKPKLKQLGIEDSRELLKNTLSNVEEEALFQSYEEFSKTNITHYRKIVSRLEREFQLVKNSNNK